MISVPPESNKGWRPLPLPTATSGVDESILHAFLAFQGAVDLHQQLVMQNLSADGTQPAQVTLLRVVATYPGLCQREIADVLCLSRTRVTTILQGLESIGAIERVHDQDDQRLARVYLTQVGQAIDASKEALRIEHINRVFGSLTDEERADLCRCMAKVSQGIRSLAQPSAVSEHRKKREA
jgi:MarR family transcriptional regulator, organic hydroperoxide resistance regulator